MTHGTITNWLIRILHHLLRRFEDRRARLLGDQSDYLQTLVDKGIPIPPAIYYLGEPIYVRRRGTKIWGCTFRALPYFTGEALIVVVALSATDSTPKEEA